MSDVRAVGLTPLFTDDFNRPDTTMGDSGGAGLGPAWSGGHWVISSNTAKPADHIGWDFWLTPTPTPDQWVEATVSPANTVALGLNVRLTNFADNCYMAGSLPPSEGNGYRLGIRTGGKYGPFTVLASNTVAHADTVRLRMEAEGSTIRLFAGGVLQLTATDPTYTTQSYVGFECESYAGLPGGNLATYDDFAAGPIGAIPVIINNSLHAHTAGAATVTAAAGAIFVGTSVLSNLFVGTTQVNRAFLGTTKIWDASVPTAPALATARSFNTSDSDLWVSLGSSTGDTFDAVTIAIFGRALTDNVIDAFLSWEGSSGSSIGFTGRYSDNKLAVARAGGSYDNSGPTFLSSEGWTVLAVTKTAGTVVPRFHKVSAPTGTPAVHQNAAIAVGPWSAPGAGGHFRLANDTFHEPFHGHVAGIGVFPTALSDANVEALVVNWDQWVTLGAKHLWVLDQATPAGPVLDSIPGGGADQTNVFATTVVPAVAPIAWAGSRPATVPGQPTSLAATSLNTGASLSWTAPAGDGGASISDYTVQYRTTTGPGAWNTFAHTASTATTISVTGLTNGTGYDFQVAAVNSVGAGTYSATASATPAPPAVPGAPTALAGTPAGAQVALTWTAPVSTGGVSLVDYTVQWRTTAGPGAWNTFAHTASTATAMTVTGLTNATSYDFQVAAVNSVGAGPFSTTISRTPAVPTVPGAPTSVVGTPANGQVLVAWAAPASNGGAAISDYTVQYAVSPPGTSWTTFSHTASTATTLTVTGLTNGTAYVFRVAAVNSVGAGSFSSSSAAVTPAAATWAGDFTTAPNGVPSGWTTIHGTEYGPASVNSGVYRCQNDSGYSSVRYDTPLATTKIAMRCEYVYVVGKVNLSVAVTSADDSHYNGINLNADGSVGRIYAGGGDTNAATWTPPAVGTPFIIDFTWNNYVYTVSVNGTLVSGATFSAGGTFTPSYFTMYMAGGAGLRRWSSGDAP